MQNIIIMTKKSNKIYIEPNPEIIKESRFCFTDFLITITIFFSLIIQNLIKNIYNHYCKPSIIMGYWKMWFFYSKFFWFFSLYLILDLIFPLIFLYHENHKLLLFQYFTSCFFCSPKTKAAVSVFFMPSLWIEKIFHKFFPNFSYIFFYSIY